MLLTRVDSEHCISTAMSVLEALLLDGSLLWPMLTQADTYLPGIVILYLVFRFHQCTCLTTTHPPQLSRRSRRSSLFGPPIRNTSFNRPSEASCAPPRVIIGIEAEATEAAGDITLTTLTTVIEKPLREQGNRIWQ